MAFSQRSLGRRLLCGKRARLRGSKLTATPEWSKGHVVVGRATFCLVLSCVELHFGDEVLLHEHFRDLLHKHTLKISFLTRRLLENSSISKNNDRKRFQRKDAVVAPSQRRVVAVEEHLRGSMC